MDICQFVRTNGHMFILLGQINTCTNFCPFCDFIGTNLQNWEPQDPQTLPSQGHQDQIFQPLPERPSEKSEDNSKKKPNEGLEKN